MSSFKMNHNTLSSLPGKCFAALVSLGFSTLLSAAATPSDWPTPGDYVIDSDTTTTSKAGSTTVERRQLVQGATGQMKVVMRDTLAGTKPVTQSYPGTGPNKWCVPKTATAPPAEAVALCGNPTAGRGEKNACGWQSVVQTWRRIDDRTWERTIKATLAAGTEVGGGPSVAAMGSSLGNQSAKAMPATPTSKDTAAAMAPVIAALEDAIRTGSADEKASAKQQLAILRGTEAPQGSGNSTVESKETWKRVSETCRS
jgi:hypothetical protein